MKKETAVDWLIDAIRNQIAEGTLNAIAISELKMKAKAIEKEQLMEAHYAPKYGCFSEEYYNETYK
jgi:hypothetical protein